MPAACLPLELQQQIFSVLDSKSFHAARRVCKWWNHASYSRSTLAAQLNKLPIQPLVNARQKSPHQLHRLFNEAASTLMLGMQMMPKSEEPGNLDKAQGVAVSGRPEITTTLHGLKSISVNNRTIAEFDAATRQAKVLDRILPENLVVPASNGLWLKITPAACHELALSSDRRLLAVAQERTIQIHDLSDNSECEFVNEYVPSAAGHYICGLDFEQNNHILRVRLSGKGTVLYLGLPPKPSIELKNADIQHWKGPAGLQHTFLNSAQLVLRTPTQSEDHTARVSGVQLLHALGDGYLFAGQRHGGGQSSHYIVGHAKCSADSDNNPIPSVIEPSSVTELVRLESFLSACDYSMGGLAEAEMGGWDNMPCAHEHHPRFTLCPDSNLLVLAEREKKQIRPMPRTQVFVYRIPSDKKLTSLLEEKDAERKGRWSTLANFLDRLEAEKNDLTVDQTKEESLQGHTIARIPLSLGTVQGEATDLELNHFLSARQQGHVVSVSAEQTTSWRLIKI